MALPFRIAARPPWTATGTMGACAWIAMMKPPFLNGSNSPPRLRVPSGKIRKELPARSESAPHSIDCIACSRFVARDRHEAANVEDGAHDRELVQFGLVEDVQLRMQRPEEHRGIDVALVIGAEDDCALGHVRPSRYPISNAS